jgi:Big-like domain-containing protein/cadherin-like protein
LTVHRRAIAVLVALLAVAPAAGLTAPSVLAVTTAEEDAYATPEDTPLTVPAPGTLTNDTTDTGTLCVTAFDTTDLQGSLGAGVAEDGSFTFTPSPNANGSTTFTYDVALLVIDGTTSTCGETVEGTAEVTITVEPVNDPPTAVADTFTALTDRTLTVGPPGVLRNDSDIDGDSVTAVKVDNPGHGVVTLAPDGGFSYTPASGFVGTDSFSYRASDGTALSETRAVTLNVTSLPTPRPTPVPPTPAPTPSPEVTDEPSPSPTTSPEPSPSASPSVAPSGSPSAGPSATPVPGDPATSAGGLSIPVIVVGLLLISLLAFGAAAFVPKWLARQRAGDELDEDGDLEDEDDDRTQP